LREQFIRWAANDDARFQSLAKDNALLAELKPLSKDLSALGVAGLRILTYLEGRRPAPKTWLSPKPRARPHAQTEERSCAGRGSAR